jgi:hypothetical protein
VKDTREDILARLLVVVAGIPNIKTTYRNNVDIPEEALPAAIVFDGDEETNGASIGQSKPSTTPLIATMTPEILVAQQADQVGPELTALRRELIRRVLTDTQLIALVGTNGSIRYLGCQTDVGWMRSLHGVLMGLFSFQYSLKIEEL